MAPKFLQNIKTRLFATTAATASTIGASAYLASVPASQVSDSLTSIVGAFTTSLLIATAPQIAATVLGIASNIISGDLHEKLKKEDFYKKIPPEANLYQASFFAFQSILDDVVKAEENKSDKKQIKKLRDITLEKWLELVSLDEQEDNISAVAEAVLSKFKDEKIVENQFVNGEMEENQLSRQDWLILLLRLQGKEQNYLTTDLEDKILDRLESDFKTRLRSVFSAHQETFQEITLQLWENLFGQLDRMEGKIDRILDGKKSSSQIPKPQGLINISEDGNAFFTEQGNVLPDLETQLKSKHIACLHGKHGLGKTTNAREFARRQKENYGFIVFLQSAEQIIENSIVDFADRYVPELQSLPLFEREQVKRDTKLKLFKEFLDGEHFQTGGKRAWLLIFDNLDRLEHIEKYFPSRRNGDILYTCNDDLWTGEKCEVPIKEFSQKEAELFLYKTSDERKDAQYEDIPAQTLADIQKILTDYGRLPFVLSKFRNYLSEIRISHAQFYDELKNNERRYLEAFDAHIDYQFKNEIVAFSVSFEKIAAPDDESEHAKIISRLTETLLNISAFCFADRIPEEILKETLFNLADLPETTASKDILFREAFRKLERFDLLNDKPEIFDYLEKKEIADETGNIIDVIYKPYQKEEAVYISHRTIQKILKIKLEHEDQTRILSEIISVLKSFIPWCFLETWKIYEKYFSNAETLIEEAKKLRLATEDLGFISNQFGNYQMQLAQIERSVQFYQEALLIGEKTVGKKHQNYATRLNNLANVYRMQGRYDRAIELFKEALLIGEKTIGKEHPAYATRLSNLAVTYRLQGRYDEAIKLYEQALPIKEKTVGKDHADYATGLSNLANVYNLQGAYTEAIELFKQSLLIVEKTTGKEHPTYAAILNNLASVYQSQGEYDEAIELYKQVLLVGEKTIGKEHTNYAIGLNNLAVVYRMQGRYDEAIYLYNQAKDIIEKSLGKENPSYATRLGNLAVVYELQGKFTEALESYEQSLSIFEKTLPENHSNIIQLRESVARCRATLDK